MLNPTRNKMRALGPMLVSDGPVVMNGTCPRCGQGGRGCRNVELGLFCAQWGLIEDVSKRYLPQEPEAPDPALAHPDVQAATAIANAALDAATRANDAFNEAMREAIALGVEVPGVMVMQYIDQHRQRLSRKEKRRAAPLSEQIEELKIKRDVTHEARVRADSAFLRTLSRAKLQSQE